MGIVLLEICDKKGKFNVMFRHHDGGHDAILSRFENRP